MGKFIQLCEEVEASLKLEYQDDGVDREALNQAVETGIRRAKRLAYKLDPGTWAKLYARSLKYVEEGNKPEDNELAYATMLDKKNPAIYAAKFPEIIVKANEVYSANPDNKSQKMTELQDYILDSVIGPAAKKIMFKTRIIQTGIIRQLSSPKEIVAHIMAATKNFAEKLQSSTMDFKTTQDFAERNQIAKEKAKFKTTEPTEEETEATGAEREAEETFSKLINS